jgi:hypothetical protein
VKPRPTKTSSISRRVSVQVAGPPRRIAGQRHVDRVRAQPLVELGRPERADPLLELRLERLLDLVAALADGTPLLRRQVLDRAQHLRQLGFAAEVPHPQLLELGRRPGGRDRLLGLAADLLKSGGRVSHGRPSYCRARTARWRPPSRR